MRLISQPVLALLMTGWLAAGAIAQTSLPALEAFERDVRLLYRSAAQHSVRVSVPVYLSTRLLDEQHPLSKWAPALDPKLREQLVAATKTQGESPRVFVEVRQATTQAATQSSTQPADVPQETTRIPVPPQTATVNVEFLGLVLNESGLVLVPLFIDTAFLNAPLQVTADDQSVTTATVVAADRLTSLTVIRLAKPLGKPAKFAAIKPSPGSLLLMMAPTRRAVRMGVWTGSAEENAVLVDSRGEFSAIVRNGHALFPSTYMPVVRQLMDGQPVKRATLGMLIREVAADDPARAQLPALGARAAARVLAVFPNSAAARAGLRQGDVVLKINDETVEDVATFAAAIANCRGVTQLHILRNGERQTVAVELLPQ